MEIPDRTLADLKMVGERIEGYVGYLWIKRFGNPQNARETLAHAEGETAVIEQFPTDVFWPSGTIVIDLPDEVSIDIRRIELQSKFQFPDKFIVGHYWHLEGRKLVIDRRWDYVRDGMIKIHYVKDHGPVYPGTENNPQFEIDGQVDKNYLRKMANLWLWTHEIQMKHKDNPIAVDMFNQAKMDEDNLSKKNIPENNLMPKDLCYFW